MLGWQVPSARSWAKRNGWTSLWAPAALGKGGGASGGTAVFMRKELGLRGPDVGSHIVADAKIVIGIADIPGHRPIILSSTYLMNGTKLSKPNCDLLDSLAKAVNAQGAHYTAICGGDFQNPPERVAEQDAVGDMRARVVAASSARGTFRTSLAATNLDYFIMSESLAMTVERVELQEGTGTKSHVPIQVIFKEKPISLQTLALRKPQPSPRSGCSGLCSPSSIGLRLKPRPMRRSPPRAPLGTRP